MFSGGCASFHDTPAALRPNMTLLELFRNIRPYARPYRGLIALTLGMTCVASFTAQVNAWVLRHTVDSISSLVAAHKSLIDGLPLLTAISAILVGTTGTIRVPYSRNDSPQIHAERPIGGAEQN